ncbi:hypothetical protein [Hymenobacter rubidus]|uniref:hypothetical protein n=1 Tax=Hymenobacter rubidus TaxID=1441626 RepID=UPI00191E6D93|nr:hypothetical protein [Hymenobacter rubidus]
MSMRLFYSIFSLALGLLLPATGVAQYYFRTPDAVLPVRKNSVSYTHVDVVDNLPLGSKVQKGQQIAVIQPEPAVQSEGYDLVLAGAKKAYDEGFFPQAAAALADAVVHEPDNPFLLYHYARALYKTDETKPQSYTVYQQLIAALARQGGENDTIAVVDMWFPEAYWKLGTLQMDNAQWAAAVDNIARALLSLEELGTLNSTPIHEEALAYLTECFYNLQNAKLCRYYGNRTLKLFPHNRYVQPYLAHLPPVAPPKAKRK